jgi:hypothetical protein
MLNEYQFGPGFPRISEWRGIGTAIHRQERSVFRTRIAGAIAEASRLRLLTVLTECDRADQAGSRQRCDSDEATKRDCREVVSGVAVLLLVPGFGLMR